jgi:hypothetical protein
VDFENDPFKGLHPML